MGERGHETGTVDSSGQGRRQHRWRDALAVHSKTGRRGKVGKHGTSAQVLGTRVSTLVVDFRGTLHKTATSTLSLLAAGHAKHLVVELNPVVVSVPEYGTALGD